MKKRIFDLVFILIAAAILIVLSAYGDLEKYIGFASIPILGAYQLGKYSERKLKNNKY